MKQCIESGEVTVEVGKIKESLFKLIKYYDSLNVSKKNSTFDNNVCEPTRKLLNRRYEMKMKIFFKINFDSVLNIPLNIPLQVSLKENELIISTKSKTLEISSPSFQIDFQYYDGNTSFARWYGEYVDINVFIELMNKLGVQFTL